MSIRIPREKTFDRVLNKVQDNIAGAIEKLFGQPLGTFTMQLTGCAVTPQVTAAWQQAPGNGPITLTIPSILATSNAATTSLTGLPVILWPKTAVQVFVPIQDSGTEALGLMTIGTDGSLTLYKSLTASASGWTTSGTKGVTLIAVTYNPSI